MSFRRWSSAGWSCFCTYPNFWSVFNSKSLTHFGPWSHRNGTAWFSPDPSIKNCRSSDPMAYIWSLTGHIPRYDPVRLMRLHVTIGRCFTMMDSFDFSYFQQTGLDLSFPDNFQKCSLSAISILTGCIWWNGLQAVTYPSWLPGALGLIWASLSSSSVIVRYFNCIFI